MNEFGISTGEAEQDGAEIVIPLRFRGVNQPEVFVTAFNTAKVALEEKSNILDFLFSLWPIIKKVLKISK